MIELALANILANMVTRFGNTELNYISDFKTSGLSLISKIINICYFFSFLP